jgi:hypothetical protein
MLRLHFLKLFKRRFLLLLGFFKLDFIFCNFHTFYFPSQAFYQLPGLTDLTTYFFLVFFRLKDLNSMRTLLHLESERHLIIFLVQNNQI